MNMFMIILSGGLSALSVMCVSGAKFRYYHSSCLGCGTFEKDCSSEREEACSGDSTSSQTCYYTNRGQSRCSSSVCGLVSCTYYSRPECECHSDCNFFNEILATTELSCQDEYKLLEIDSEVGNQIGLNILNAIGGNLPVVGPIADTAFAIYDPFSFVTSPFALANTILDEVEDAINDLKNCMDEQFIAFHVDLLSDLATGLYYEFSVIRGSTGDVRRGRLNYAFVDFGSELVSMFTLTDDEAGTIDYTEFLGMLPIYLSLYPMYTSLVVEQLLYLKYEANDLENFNNDLVHALELFSILENWINLAKALIFYHYDGKIIDAECRNHDAMETKINEWIVNFDETYIDGLIDHRDSIQLIADSA